MGLSVGTVQIDYWAPIGAAYNFAWNLAEELDDRCWQVSGEGNAFIELEYELMVERAARFIEIGELGATDAHAVMRWVRGLPWRGEVVMLHLAW